MAYLDHAATTPMRPEAIEALTAALAVVGNPSSIHSAGQQAKRLLEESRERVAATLGADGIEVVFTGSGTEAVNLAIKGLWWSRQAAGPGGEAAARPRILVPAGEHHATIDTVEWLAAHEGAVVVELPLDEVGRLRLDVLEAELARDAASVALVTMLWANNEVGTIQPVEEVARLTARAGVPLHVDAIAAYGQVPIDVHALRRATDAAAGVGLVALSVSAHKIGGPVGIGALVLDRVGDRRAAHPRRRTAAPGALRHPGRRGGGGVRGGGRPRCTSELDADALRMAALRDRLIAGALGRGARGPALGRPRSGRAPARQRALLLPRLRGRLAALPARRGRASRCRPARRARRACPSRRTCSWRWAARRPTPAARCASRSGHASTDADVDAFLAALPGRVRPGGEGRPRRRARRRSIAEPDRTREARRASAQESPAYTGRVKVLAAMSGGVDSAVAAARAVEAGHEVVGVHLALSRMPGTLRTGSRGCCTIEDSMDAQRAANVLGIPYYVWDFSERFKADVVDDFIAEYSAGRTPNPCMRCNERIKFAALLEKALALGFDAVAHRPLRRRSSTDAAGNRELHRASAWAKDQSYVLGVLTTEQLAHAYFPLGDTPSKAARARGGRRARPLGRAEARLARHLLHPRRRHQGLARRARRRRDGRHRRPHGRRASARTRARTPTPSASARDCTSARPRPTDEPRFVLEVRPKENTVVVGPKEALATAEIAGSRFTWAGLAPDGCRRRRSPARCRSARTPTPCRRWRCVADGELVDHPGASARRRRPRADGRRLRRHPRARPVHDRPHRQRGRPSTA